MCGRYTLRRANLLAAALRAIRMLPGFEEFTERPHYNVAPSHRVPIVRPNARGERTVGLVQWGLVPSWTRGKPKHQPINARSETIATNGMFRGAFERRRCLVPADGFYEWQVQPDDTKQPMFIHRDDDSIYTFAGLWERWTPEEAEPLDTCTIITTTANELMKPIHERMPVILDEHDFDRWLDRDTSGQQVIDLLKPASPDGWNVRPVSKAVNSPRNDGPQLLDPPE